MKKKYVLLLIVFTTNVISSQDFGFGDVSIGELEEKSYFSDTTINAAILYAKKKIHYNYSEDKGFTLITEVHKRIKLYRKEGFEHGSHTVWLYKNQFDEEKVISLRANTYSQENGKVTKTKLGKEGIFKSEYSEKYNQVKFTLPKLAEGVVIEYKYKKSSPFLVNVGRIPLQYYIPIKKMFVELSAPEYFNFKKFTSGYLPVNLKETSSNGSVQSGGKNIPHRVNNFQIHANAVPAFKKEPYCGNPLNYISAISFELAYIDYPYSGVKHYATTWSDVVNTVYKNSRFGKELEKMGYFEEDIDQLLKGVSDPKLKVAKILNFVKEKIKWNERIAVYSYKGLKKAYKEGTGNSAEINLMLGAMLKYAKINTNMVLVGTKDKVTSLFPTLDGFNDVICRVRLEDNTIMLLDASDRYSCPNILPDRVLRGTARMIREDGESISVVLRPKKASVKRCAIQCVIKESGVIKGKMNVNHLDYLAHRFRTKYDTNDETSNSKRIQEKFELKSLSSYTQTGLTELDKAIGERFDFEVDNQAEIIGNEVFISPLLFLKDTENTFKAKERTYPIDFGHGFSNTYMINIKIPEGYETTELPENLAFKLPDNLGSFMYKISSINNNISVMVKETINAPMIPAQYYGAIKEFYNQVVEKENEQVVIKKI